MNVAIPLFGSRISPRFDFCQELLIVTIEDGIIVDKKTVSISSLTPLQRIAELSNRNVKTIICGGINRLVQSHLRNNGISVIYDVMGEAEEALDRYLKGRLRPRAFCESRRKRASKRGTGAPWQLFPPGKRSGGSVKKEDKNE
ncbi:MAG: NifB/NifX family molybdenum-iron cluster-binding protein [Deltaproteobacteria bacterium]|nr:NifB/NifX family molybdenum-iron cluster-binding protein [Deltaproteobacteria bacterium]MBW2122636.1 NifB/NifX family molybdenum-iron cluster-binding protein [Deltaproteobacteria bacterium]